MPAAYGSPPAPARPAPEPDLDYSLASTVDTHLVWAILATLFCCMPFGVVAIVYAAMAESKKGEGNYVGAVDVAEKAQTWCWVSTICGIVAYAIWLFLFMLAQG